MKKQSNKIEISARMSHELRSPLNVIIGLLILSLITFGDRGPEKYVSYGHDILISANDLLEQIDDILDFSKIEAEEKIDFQALEVEPLFKEIIKQLEMIWRKEIKNIVTYRGGESIIHYR